MRIDKFLKNARIIKRRSVGKDACDGGRVSINDKVVKPGDQVKPGDIITIRYGDGEQKVEVLELLEHAPKDKAGDMYREL
ncbi:MAG: RNA-binding S4 domain-containing protein [Acetobacterium sp.]|jgi:ribosomal 50S subunit-recycling heat shock protein|nr:RNA-binding S4 domain-containing protein [Acetobacterium woodii]MBU4438949.1 RNA-binding S4 domain-containing protein [Bacillota bacterium]MCG2730513.1 RNA-binding S4 domain-containing protein [Acetobacterium sp.]